jgi:sugar phosphate isomerase/epimerase
MRTTNPYEAPCTRREFVTTTAAGAAAVATAGWSWLVPPRRPPYELAFASHSFHELNVDRMLPRIAEMGLTRIEFNDRHLSVFASDRDLEEFTARLEETGIEAISTYTSGFTADEAEARHIFEFARTVDLQFFAGAPSPEILPLLNRLAGEYDVPVALHNSSGESAPYRTLDDMRSALEAHANLAACIDLGHFALAGTDPVRAVRKLGGQAIELHVKDLTTFDRSEAENPYTVVGEGKMDWDGIFKALDDTGFDGWLALEYQADFWDLAARARGIRKSIEALRRMLSAR